MSLTNLRKFREFYLSYAEIQQAVPVKSLTSEMGSKKIQQAVPTTSVLDITKLETLTGRFVLGWTHYVTLLTVKNTEERRFYEMES